MPPLLDDKITHTHTHECMQAHGGNKLYLEDSANILLKFTLLFPYSADSLIIKP